MLIFIFASVLAAASALPAPQILTPATALNAIPAANHILILTPQAQVQLEPSLKYSQPIIQHLTPVGRIDSPTDQTVVYYPNENLINNLYQKPEIQPKQIETTNLTNIVNQFVSAGQTAQAQLEAFQQQLTQGLETLIQPSGVQKTEVEKYPNSNQPLESALGEKKIIESTRHESGRFYSVPGASQFYNNFELIQAPLNPIYAVHPYSAVRARNVALPVDILSGDVPLVTIKNTGEMKLQNESVDIQPETTNLKKKNTGARSFMAIKAPGEQSHSGNLNTQDPSVQKVHEVDADSSNFGKYLVSLENNGVPLEKLGEAKNEEGPAENSRKNEGEKNSFAEAIPIGLAISGEGGLSQTKPVGSAIVGKEGVAFSAPSGTAITGSSDDKDK